MLIEEWHDRFGWMVGALVIMMVFAAMIAHFRSARSVQIVHVLGMAVGLGIGGLLFIPAVPRIVTALHQMIVARVPINTSGPFLVAAADVLLPSSSTNDAPILVRLWYPAADKPLGAANRPGSMIAHQRLDVLVEQRLATGVQEQFPLLLYAPGNGALRDDSASTAAELASHGYVIAAIDDVDLAPLPSDFVGDKPLPLVFDYSSEEVFGRFLQTGDSKVRREAKQALTVLDRLTACANVNWHTRVRFDQVGFFGFSFGGAVAAQAATWDPRIAAVANLDGTLFDRAATGALKKPYIVFLTKEDIFPKPLELQSPEPAKRYFAALMERDLREEVGLANQRDGFGLRIRNSYHENLSDQAFSRRFFKTWFLVDPYRVKTIRDAYLLGFFDTYLRGMPSPLLTQAPSPFDEVEILRADPYWLAAVQKSAPEAAAGPN